MSKKPMYEIPGTIAYALTQNVSEWKSATTVSELKQKAIDIVNRSEIKNPQDKVNFLEAMQSGKSVSGLMSTLGTYMLGMKV